MSSTHINPNKLISQAEKLAGKGNASGRPINSDLRRAVSSSYYALFHAMTLAATAEMMPDCTLENRLRLTRHFDHGSIAKFCGWVVGKTPDNMYGALIDEMKLSPTLIEICATFTDLKESRFQADYDHLVVLKKPEVLSLVARSKAAIKLIPSLAGTHEGEEFYFLLTATSSGSAQGVARKS